MARSFDEVGEPLGTEWVAGSFQTPDVAFLGDGGVVIAGCQYDVGALARLFDHSGVPLGDAFFVSEAGVTDLWSWPRVAAASDGRFVVAYVRRNNNQPDDPGVFWRRFSADGVPIGSDHQVPAKEGREEDTPDVGMADDGSVVVAFLERRWGGIGWNACCYSPTDEQVGNCLHVSTASGSPPRIIVASDGHFVVTYSDYDEAINRNTIWVRAYDASCSPTINPVDALSVSNLSGSGSAVGLAADGDFVVAWQGYDPEQDQHGVYARRFEPNGTPKGPELRLDRRSGDASSPAIAVHPDGSFVAAWVNDSQDGDGWGVFAQRFGTDGLPAAQVP
jgi:hypothetical protein